MRRKDDDDDMFNLPHALTWLVVVSRRWQIVYWISPEIIGAKLFDLINFKPPPPLCVSDLCLIPATPHSPYDFVIGQKKLAHYITSAPASCRVGVSSRGGNYSQDGHASRTNCLSLTSWTQLEHRIQGLSTVLTLVNRAVKEPL